VVDGDTIIVHIGGREERVRYIGVNAPELANVERGVEAECGAFEAALANRELVEGQAVTLEQDVTERDRFGRLLRHVWVDRDGWRLVTEALVDSGAVRARSYPPDTGRDSQLDVAEGAARSAGRGIWGSC
jgi:micrococcal nuclease